MRVLTKEECGLLKLACRYVHQRDGITTAGAADLFRRNPAMLVELADKISAFDPPKDGPAKNLRSELMALAEALKPAPAPPAPAATDPSPDKKSPPTKSPATAPASTPISDETIPKP